MHCKILAITKFLPTEKRRSIICVYLYSILLFKSLRHVSYSFLSVINYSAGAIDQKRHQAYRIAAIVHNARLKPTS